MIKIVLEYSVEATWFRPRMSLTDHMNSRETIVSTLKTANCLKNIQNEAQVASNQVISNSIRMGGQKQ